MSARGALIGLLTVLASVAPSTRAAAELISYSIVGHLSGTGGSWDDAVVDERHGRLYLAQSGVTVVDLKTQTVTTGLVNADMSHGVALLGDGAVAVDDSKSKMITVFAGADGKILSTIDTAKYNPVSGIHALDALVFEPKTRLLIAANGESGLLLLADVAQSQVVGSIFVGGHPESAAADGAGRIFINVNHKTGSEMATVDIASRAIVQRTPLPGCEGATGLSYDADAGLVLSVCDNGLFKALDERTSRVMATLPVGGGADAVMFDHKRRLAFIASADSGTLNIIAVRSATDITLVQTLRTRAGTRSGAVDVDSGRVYLPSASFGPPQAPNPYPSVKPGTFEFLIVAPN